MIAPRIATRLRRQTSGSVTVEFALLAPMFLAMLFGVLAIGTQMQDYNSMRSVGYDVNRRVVIEYQKDNKLTKEQIEALAYLVAEASPYNLTLNQFYAVAEKKDSGMTGAKKFELTMVFTPFNVSSVIGVKPPTFTQKQAIIVPD